MKDREARDRLANLEKLVDHLMAQVRALSEQLNQLANAEQARQDKFRTHG